jgi:hypothetical protein
MMKKIALASALCCALLAGEGAAQTSQPIRVQFGVGESSKTLQLSRPEISARAEVRATASTFAAERVCNLPDNRSALERFITEYSNYEADTVRYELGRLIEDANDESGARVLINLRDKFGPTGASRPVILNREGGVVVAVSGNEWSDLNSGKSVTSVVQRRCLAVDEARAWLREASRVLSLYFGLTPDQ